MSLLLLLAALAAGLALQRAGDGGRVRSLVWGVFFYCVSPALVLVTFLELHISRPLVLSLANVAMSASAEPPPSA